MFVRHDLTDTVPTPSGNMHFVKKGTGYPVVLLHPAGTSVWAWETVLETLSQSFTCYAFDMMEHGNSDKPNRHFGIPDYAQALDQACQILNIHRAHVVGNSVGAVLAIETTASFSERQKPASQQHNQFRENDSAQAGPRSSSRRPRGFFGTSTAFSQNIIF